MLFGCMDPSGRRCDVEDVGLGFRVWGLGFGVIRVWRILV